MEKKSKGKTIAIIILFLSVLGLSGYIVYDKVLNKEVKEPVKTEKKENVKIEEGFNLDNKSEIQALTGNNYYKVYISKNGEAFLTIDNVDNEEDAEIKANITKLQNQYQDNTIEGICLTGDEQHDKEMCENGDVLKSIKLDIEDVVSAYDMILGQDIFAGGILFIKKDGTISSLSMDKLLGEGKAEIKNNLKNLKNIVTIVQSGTTNALSGHHQAIAIEKDGTQHVIDSLNQ